MKHIPSANLNPIKWVWSEMDCEIYVTKDFCMPYPDTKFLERQRDHIP